MQILTRILVRYSAWIADLSLMANTMRRDPRGDAQGLCPNWIV